MVAQPASASSTSAKLPATRFDHNSHRHLDSLGFLDRSAAGLPPHHLAHHRLELQAHGLGHHRRAEQVADDRRQRLGQLEARFVFESYAGTPFERNDRQVVAARKRTQCLRRAVDFAGLGARNDALVRLLRDARRTRTGISKKNSGNCPTCSTVKRVPWRAITLERSMFGRKSRMCS